MGDNAFDILDVEIEPLPIVVDEEDENVEDIDDDTSLVGPAVVDIAHREKSTQSIELDNCWATLMGELDTLTEDDTQGIETLQKVNVEGKKKISTEKESFNLRSS